MTDEHKCPHCYWIQYEFPTESYREVCLPCLRAGDYPAFKPIEETGPDVGSADLRAALDAAGGKSLVDEAIWIMQNCEPPGGYLGAFSGGKDSIALHEIARMAGVKVEWHYHNTTIDPPEVIYFMRMYYPHVIWDKPKHGNFFNRMKQKGVVPSRKIRWCCDEYKEVRGPLNCVWLTGVRREESAGRSLLPVAGLHTRTRRVHVRPLSNWDSEFLWGFIRERGLAYPSLYDEGFTRLGCVGCPLASAKNRRREMERWPRIEAKWKDAIKYCWEKRKKTKQKNGLERIGSAYMATWEEFYDAWLNDKPIIKKQETACKAKVLGEEGE